MQEYGHVSPTGKEQSVVRAWVVNNMSHTSGPLELRHMWLLRFNCLQGYCKHCRWKYGVGIYLDRPAWIIYGTTIFRVDSQIANSINAVISTTAGGIGEYPSTCVALSLVKILYFWIIKWKLIRTLRIRICFHCNTAVFLCKCLSFRF